MKYASTTTVSVAKSKAEIEDTVIRYGASSFGTMQRNGESVIGFEYKGRGLKFILPLPDLNSEEFQIKTAYGKKKETTPEEAYKLWEQACRQRWRALALCIKAKLEAVNSGITTFEEEFLAHFVMKGGKTLGETMLPQLEEHYASGKMPKLLSL